MRPQRAACGVPDTVAASGVGHFAVQRRPHPVAGFGGTVGCGGGWLHADAREGAGCGAGASGTAVRPTAVRRDPDSHGQQPGAQLHGAARACASGRGKRHILVLHDVVLHHLMVWRAVLRRGGREAYRREMRARYGTAADAVAAQVLRGQNPPAMFDYPLNEELIRAARLVVTHSPSAAAWVERLVPGTETRVVPMGVPDQWRREIGRRRGRASASGRTRL